MSNSTTDPNSPYSYRPLLTLSEASGVPQPLPPPLTPAEVISQARKLTGRCFPGGRLPKQAIALQREARKRRQRVHLISWPDGTRAALFFPRKDRAAHIGMALPAYICARTRRELAATRVMGGKH